MKVLNTLVRATIFGAATLGLANAANAAATCPAGFSDKMLEIWNGYSPGGLSDVVSRSLAAIMEKQQGWKVIVLNKPGAGTSLMLTELARTEPDGHVMGISAGPAAITRVPYENKNSQYNPDDFTYIGTAQQNVTGYASLTTAPFSNWEELVAYAKKKGRVTLSTAGVDPYTVNALNEAAGINIVVVPAAGAGEAMQQVLGGHTDMAAASTTHIVHLRAGTVRQILTLGSKRAPFADYATTTKEAGYDLAGTDYFSYFVAPKGLSPELTTCLAEALDEAVNTEEYTKVAKNFQNEPFNLGPKGLRDFIMKDAAVFKEFYAKGSK